jgi:hypothetical protein
MQEIYLIFMSDCNIPTAVRTHRHWTYKHTHSTLTRTCTLSHQRYTRVFSLNYSCTSGLQILSIHANILNKQSQTADEGWSSSLQVGRAPNKSSPCYEPVPKRRWENNIKIDPRKGGMGGMDRIDAPQSVGLL